jgi:glycosyltransferase involved in cell wall biosynthesis
MDGKIPAWVLSETKYPLLVINQCDSDFIEQLSSTTRVLHTRSRGLAASRNIALETSVANYVYFCDNDNHFFSDGLDALLVALKEDEPDAAICSSNHFEFSYKEKKVLTLRDAFSVASWQICVRRDVGLQAMFDTRFGLGSSKISHGEENIFLARILRCGGRIIGYPTTVVFHPDLGTGYLENQKFYSEKLAIYREMVGLPLAVALLCRKFLTRLLRRAIR